LSAASYDVRIDQDVIVSPHGFALASTVERFHMPNDLAGTVRDNGMAPPLQCRSSSTENLGRACCSRTRTATL
jgi:hypothetical protein